MTDNSQTIADKRPLHKRYYATFDIFIALTIRILESRFTNPSLRKTRTNDFGLIGRSFLCKTRPRIYLHLQQIRNFFDGRKQKKATGNSSRLSNPVAEREGFEPPEPCSSTVFKTAAIDHSAIFPRTKVTPIFDTAKSWLRLIRRLSSPAPQRTDGRQALPGPSGQRIPPQRPFNFRLWVFGIPKFA